MDRLTKQLKIELWNRFGTKEYPSEWDGFVYGGGKLSQRYWEYLIAIELLGLDENSVVLDIGGGSPVTGAGFFASLISKYVKKVIILDNNASVQENLPPNITIIGEDASAETLQNLLIKEPEVSHISCISVFEHIGHSLKEEMVQSIKKYFRGKIFVATFEYHAKTEFFEGQLTAETVSHLFKHFTNYYLSEFSSSPVWCEDAYESLSYVNSEHRLFKICTKAKNALVKMVRSQHPGAYFPKWNPIAVKFEKI